MAATSIVKIAGGGSNNAPKDPVAFIRDQLVAQSSALNALRTNQEVGIPWTDSQSGQGISNPFNTKARSDNSISAADRAANEARAAENRAKQAGKDRSAKENEATQNIINALLDSLKGYEGGRDTQIANANSALTTALAGIKSSLLGAVTDYNKTADLNEEDQASKTAANLQNRARERVSLLQQAASQGAGETDQLRAQIQAFLNADANQLEVDQSFFDTQRQINSQIEGANNQAETARRTAWNQNQEALGSAWNDFWKNQSDVWTNIQRTAAANNNVDSDYSTGFKADLRGNNAVQKASEFAGKTYKTEEKDDAFFKQDRQEGRDTKTTSVNRAGTTAIKAPKAAEGATLRGRW